MIKEFPKKNKPPKKDTKGLWLSAFEFTTNMNFNPRRQPLPVGKK